MRYIKVNEFLANGPDPDFIELFNSCHQSIDISGCYLSDDADLLTSRYRIPQGTSIPARGFRVFVEDATNSFTFGLSPGGEQIFLTSPEGTRVLDAVGFEGQAAGVSTGRYPDGAPAFVELSTRSAGTNNAPPLTRDIVINEIMFNPISGSDDDEYIELYNRGTNTVNILNWQFSDGVRFTNTAVAALSAGCYLVVAKSASRLATNYPNLLTNGVNLVGDYSGSLANGGERVTLTTNGIVVDEVTYCDGGRWGQWADGGGSSLELMEPRSDNRLAANWADSDETAKGIWTTNISYTGVLTNGDGGPIGMLEIVLQGEGECILDDIQVIGAASTNNLVQNPGFENGANGWIFEGNHDQSHLETNGGFNGHGLRLVATGRGDYLANRIRTTLTAPLSPNTTATLGLKARWLRGQTNLLMRVQGNYLEAVGLLAVPSNLGTPGLHNSRHQANAGPAIFEVKHVPVLPTAQQVVLVQARVQDPDGIQTVRLKYRVDPGTATSLTMVDSGTGGDAEAGDGVFSASIPGQTAGTMVAFSIGATDNHAPAATNSFPSDAPARECLVRFGETQPSGLFGTYRIWMTQAVFNQWSARHKLHNSPLDTTFVYGNTRTIYNAGARYAGATGSCYYDTPTGMLCGYALEWPNDDRFLGANEGGLDWSKEDLTEQREQTVYWMAGELGLPYNHRRFVHLYVNGVKRGTIYEDSQQPNADFLEEFYPDDAEGDLYKMEVWWKTNAFPVCWLNCGQNCVGYVPTLLEKHLRSSPQGGVFNVARYRWNWLKRAAQTSAHDYSSLSNLVEAVNTPLGSNYAAAIEAQINAEQWMHLLAFSHAVANVDAYSYVFGHNIYAYKPQAGGWTLQLFDIEFVLGQGSYAQTNQDLFFWSASDADWRVTQLWSQPPFRRAFWRGARETALGPMDSGRVNPLMDATYTVLVNNGVTGAQSPSQVKSWIAGRRAYILGELAKVAAPFEISNNNGDDFAVTNQPSLTLLGKAPVEVAFLRINSTTSNAPVTWTSVTNWSVNVTLTNGPNPLTVRGYDRLNVSNAVDTITITRQ